jgi:hypothetical protein
MKRKFIWSFIGLFIIAGCASQKAVVNKTPVSEAPQGKIIEDFDPQILEDEELTINTTKSVEAKSDYDDSFLPGIGQENEGDQEVPGYRVQICAVAVEDTARNIQRDAILKFNENVYLKFDSPYYKVRIGDCKTRYEAEQLQQLVIQKGFNEAWVVKTMVRPIAKEEQPESSNSTPAP